MCRPSTAAPNTPSSEQRQQHEEQQPALLRRLRRPAKSRRTCTPIGNAGQHRVAPRRAGVRALVEERRQPRHEREQPDADRDERRGSAARVASRRATRRTSSAHRDDADEVERPVLRVHEQRDDERERARAGRASAARAPAGTRGCPHAHEQHLERVHARLGRVPDRVRVRRRARATASHAAGGPGDRRAANQQRDDGADHASTPESDRTATSPEPNTRSRRAAARSRAAARRRACSAARRSTEREPRDVDRERLVEPEIGRACRRRTRAASDQRRRPRSRDRRSPARRRRDGPRRRVARARRDGHVTAAETYSEPHALAADS